jgi:hypothetical protein
MADTPHSIWNSFVGQKILHDTASGYPSPNIPDSYIYGILHPTHLDLRSSLIKSHNSLFYSIEYFIPLSPYFSAYRLGHFDIKTLFLLRSYYKNTTKTPTEVRAVVNQARLQEPSRDHQGQVSVTAARRSSTAILDPQEPQSATPGEFGLASPYAPRARPWCTRASAAPRGSPVWLSALPISAGRP